MRWILYELSDRAGSWRVILPEEQSTPYLAGVRVMAVSVYTKRIEALSALAILAEQPCYELASRKRPARVSKSGRGSV